MHFLDPDRPRVSHLPENLAAPIRSVLPGLHISPRGTPDAPQMEISIFAPYAHGGCVRREITMSAEDFVPFWARWLADPERVLRDEFKYEPGERLGKAPLPAQNILAIDDLIDLL
jgi:hypothetical protein